MEPPREFRSLPPPEGKGGKHLLHPDVRRDYEAYLRKQESIKSISRYEGREITEEEYAQRLRDVKVWDESLRSRPEFRNYPTNMIPLGYRLSDEEEERWRIKERASRAADAAYTKVMEDEKQKAREAAYQKEEEERRRKKKSEVQPWSREDVSKLTKLLVGGLVFFLIAGKITQCSHRDPDDIEYTSHGPN